MLDAPIPPNMVLFMFLTNTCELVKDLDKIHIIMACEYIKKIKIEQS